jgi:carbonic anhydrase
VSAIDFLLANNARFAASRWTSHVDATPTLQMSIVTCMDARLHVYAGLGLGDSHSLRNARDVVTDDVAHSLAIPSI